MAIVHHMLLLLLLRLLRLPLQPPRKRRMLKPSSTKGRPRMGDIQVHTQIPQTQSSRQRSHSTTISPPKCLAERQLLAILAVSKLNKMMLEHSMEAATVFLIEIATRS